MPETARVDSAEAPRRMWPGEGRCGLQWRLEDVTLEAVRAQGEVIVALVAQQEGVGV